MTKCISFVLAVMILGSLCSAQGQHSLVSTTLGGNRQAGAMFEVTALTDLRIWRIGACFTTSSVGTHPVQVWFRPGGMSTASAGWVQAGTGNVQTTVVNVWPAVAQIPLDLNLNIPANSTYGLAVIVDRTTSTIPGVEYSNGPLGVSTSSHMSLNMDGYGLSWLGTATPPFSSFFSVRCFNGTVWYDTGPTLSASATLGTPQTILANEHGPGGNGVEAATFSISANDDPGVSNLSLTEIAIRADGSGNDQTAYDEVAIYQNDPLGADPNAFDVGDYLVDSVQSFPSPDGLIVFNVPTQYQVFTTTQVNKYFIVVKLAGTALPGHTFSFLVEDMTVTGTNAQKSGLPSAVMSGLVIDTPEFNFVDQSPAQAEKVFLTLGEVCQVFTISYPAGPDDKPSSINLTSMGTAHEVDDLDNVQLWYDQDDNATFNNLTDTLVDTQVFTQDNGTVSFSLASHPNFQAGDTRRFFVVYNLNANADDLETFRCYLADMGPAPLGGIANGLPLPSAAGTPGLEVSAAILFGVMNGPLAPVSVSSNSHGPTGDGVLIADVTLDALPGGDWIINTMTFHAGGTGSHNTAYMELGLYEDSGNGIWDGAGADALAAPVQAGFDANSVTFTLTNPNLNAGLQRRFFLAGKFNGTAAAGETFNARLFDLGAIPPQGGSTSDIPTPASTAVIIDTPVLSVANGPNQPSPATHAAGSTGSLVAAQFRLNALNGATTVNGINFTTSGSGDWTSDVVSVSIHEDNGDGIFNTADDAQLDTQPGSALITSSFTHNMAVGQITDLWVVVHFTATAGDGVSATPETFSLAIANVTDVNASAPVDFGSPAPQGITVGAIEFRVDSFTPDTAPAAGGGTLTLQGSGFVAPVTVTIGGTLCTGTPTITGGTTVTNLTIPAGFGENLPIVVQSGTLPPQTLTHTFTYTSPKDTPPPKAEEGGSCSGGGQSAWALLLLAPLAALAARRRKA